MGFGVWGLGFRVWGLGFRVWGLGFGAGLGLLGVGIQGTYRWLQSIPMGRRLGLPVGCQQAEQAQDLGFGFSCLGSEGSRI